MRAWRRNFKKRTPIAPGQTDRWCGDRAGDRPDDKGSVAIVVVAMAVAWTLAMTLVVGPVTRHLAASQHAQSAADAAALAAVLDDCGAAGRLAAANLSTLSSCERRPAPGGIGSIAVVVVTIGNVSATARASSGP